MKNILKQGSIILFFFCLWSLFFLFLIYSFYPERGVIDNSRIDGSDIIINNIFQKDVTNDLLGLWVVPHDPKRIIIIGSSNAQKGIYPYVLQMMLPDFTIYNASVKGTNITQLRNIFDVIRMSSHGSLKGTIFIIGISYSAFCNNNVKFGHVLFKNRNLTYFQSESLRYGLYSLRDNGMELTIDPYFMPMAVHLLKPYLLWNIIFSNIEQNYYDFWNFLKKIKPKDSLKGEAFKKAALALWEDSLGNINDFAENPQMMDFISLCKEIEQRGGAIVIVDLPNPQWVRERSEYYKKYILKRSFYVKEIKKIPRVRYIDLSAHLPESADFNFKDSVHSTKEGAILWSKTIGEYVVSQRQFLGF